MISVQAPEGLTSFLLNSIGKDLTIWPFLTPWKARNEILVTCHLEHGFWRTPCSLRPAGYSNTSLQGRDEYRLSMWHLVSAQ